MKDFILTLVVIFILFRILGSFRSSRVARSNEGENPTQPKDGKVRITYRKENSPQTEHFDEYEIIDEEKKEEKDPDSKS